MIEYVRGIIDELTPTTATIECHGVGYLLNISLNTYTALQNKSEARLFVYEAIREDAWTLFGFATKDERTLFLALLVVSGVGGNTARTILSTFTPAELCDIILNENAKLLTTVKGLGKKTAEKIIVELKDKVGTLDITAQAPAAGGQAATPSYNKEVHDEAIEALKMLGYPPAAATKVVRAILKDDPEAKVEKVIKMGLKML